MSQEAELLRLGGAFDGEAGLPIFFKCEVIELISLFTGEHWILEIITLNISNDSELILQFLNRWFEVGVGLSEVANRLGLDREETGLP